MKPTRTITKQPYLEVLITRDTLVDGLPVPAGTRLFGLRGQPGASHKRGMLPLVVASGRTWTLAARTWRATPRTKTIDPRVSADSLRPTLLFWLFNRQMDLAQKTFDRALPGAKASAKAKRQWLRRTAAQIAAARAGESPVNDLDLGDTERAVRLRLGRALIGRDEFPGRASYYLEPLAVASLAELEDRVGRPASQAFPPDPAAAEAGNPLALFALEVAKIQLAYSEALLQEDPFDEEAMQVQAERLSRLNPQVRLDVPNLEEACRLKGWLLARLTALLFFSTPTDDHGRLEQGLQPAQRALDEGDAVFARWQALAGGREADCAELASELDWFRDWVSPDEGPVVHALLWAETAEAAQAATGYLQARLGRRLLKYYDADERPPLGAAARCVLKCPGSKPVEVTLNGSTAQEIKAALAGLQQRLEGRLSKIRTDCVCPPPGMGAATPRARFFLLNVASVKA